MKKLQILLLVSCTYMAPMYCYKHYREETIFPEANVKLSKFEYNPNAGFYRQKLYEKIVYDDDSRTGYSYQMIVFINRSSYKGSTYEKGNAKKSRDNSEIMTNEMLGNVSFCIEAEAETYFRTLENEFNSAKAAGHEVIVKDDPGYLFADIANEFDQTTKTTGK